MRSATTEPSFTSHGALKTLIGGSPASTSARNCRVERCGSSQREDLPVRAAIYQQRVKKNGQIRWREKPSVSDLESSSLAGFFALIWSNLCTRHILFGLEPRGHHDWPHKGIMQPSKSLPSLNAGRQEGSACERPDASEARTRELTEVHRCI